MDLRTHITSLMAQARDELAELVALRSVADPRQFPPEECERAATWVLRKFAELGFTDAHLAETADGSARMSRTFRRPGRLSHWLDESATRPVATYSPAVLV